MRRLSSRLRSEAQRGVAAVEMAIILPIMLLLLAVPLYYGRVFWHYTVAQKAAHDAARYLITAPLTQMRNPAQVGNALAVANTIIDTELAELNPGPYRHAVTILCTGSTCSGFVPPTTIMVRIQMPIYDPLLSSMTEKYVGSYGLLITATATMRYAGN